MAARCARVQNVCSGRAQSTRTRCSVKCQGMLGGLGGAEDYHVQARVCKQISGQTGLIRGSSSQCKLKTMSKLTMHPRCLTKCQRHLGRSWSVQNLQILVSLEGKEGGKVSLSKTKTCQCNHLRKPNLVRKERVWFHGPKILPQGHSPGLKGFVGWFTSRKRNDSKKGKLQHGCSTIQQAGPE